MQNDTRLKFNAYLQQLAQLNGVADVTHKFTVAPTVQQTLENKMQLSSDFLSRINIIGVRDLEGEKIGLGVAGTVASTTDTQKQDREPQDLLALDRQNYRCEQTNFDTVLRYATIDTWSKFPDFQTRLRDQIVKRQALDRIMIGWNGTSRAATSDRTKNPLLQDVNTGWLQQIRTHASENWLKEIAAGSGKIQIGRDVKGADGFVNLDALVMDMVASLLEPWYQDDTELVVICGRKLLHDKYFPIINTVQAPTEMMASDLVLSQKRIGGLPAVRVPFFPADSLLVTRLDNLSLYWQEGSRRRTMVDNAKRDRIENYESSNDAYVIEDYDCTAFAEHIVLTGEAG